MSAVGKEYGKPCLVMKCREESICNQAHLGRDKSCEYCGFCDYFTIVTVARVAPLAPSANCMASWCHSSGLCWVVLLEGCTWQMHEMVKCALDLE